MPATVAGTSDTMSARSRFRPFCEPLPVPRRLMSQNTPLARKPRGAQMEPSRDLSFVFITKEKNCRDMHLTSRGFLYFNFPAQVKHRFAADADPIAGEFAEHFSAARRNLPREEFGFP